MMPNLHVGVDLCVRPVSRGDAMDIRKKGKHLGLPLRIKLNI